MVFYIGDDGGLDWVVVVGMQIDGGGVWGNIQEVKLVGVDGCCRDEDEGGLKIIITVVVVFFVRIVRLQKDIQ